MSKSPAFQFYPSDFLSDKNTMVMTTEQIGAYHLLMLFCWKEGSLPDDTEELAILCRMDLEGFQDAWDKRIKRCFDQNSAGEWIHPRLEKERKKQKSYKDKKAEAGKKGAEKRWGKDEKGTKNPQEMAENGGANSENSGANVSPMAKNASSSSSSSSTTVKNSHSQRAGASEEPSPVMAKRSGYEPTRIPPPETAQEVIDIGNMRGIPPDQCEVYFDLRSTDNFLRNDKHGNWKEILNWHSDLAHLFKKGALKPDNDKSKTNGRTKQAADPEKVARTTRGYFGNQNETPG